MKLIPIVATLGLVVAGCAMNDAPRPTSQKNNALPEKLTVVGERVPGRYSLLTPQATGVVAVFEESGRTMIQFARAVPDDLILVDAAGKVLRHERYDNYAIVAGQYEGILLRSGGGQSYVTTADPAKVTLPITASKPIAPATAVQPSTTPANAPATTQAGPAKTSSVEVIDAERPTQQPDDIATERLTEAEYHLRNIEAELAPAEQPIFSVANIMQKIATLETKVEGMNTTVVRVRFPMARTKVQLPEVARVAFMQAAEASDRIEVRGRTDSVGTVRTNSRVAYERAMSAKSYLMSLGVPAAKIRVSALPMSDYVADNASAEGRARNRRVDFVFVAPEAGKVRVSLDSPAVQQ